jgi:hypothetical protein
MHTAMRVPSGDHAGSSTCCVPAVSCRADPSATVTTKSCCTPPLLHSTASLRPYGDHDTRPPAIGAISRWCEPSASAVHTAASTERVPAGSAPTSRSTVCSVGPGTNAVTSQAGSPSGSASTTGAVWKPPTLRAAATSSANRRRKPGSVLSSGRRP